MRKRRLLWQLFSPYWLAFLLALVVVGWLTSAALERDYLARVENQLRSQALLFRDQIAPQLGREDPAILQRLCQNFGALAGNRVTVILPSGKVLCDSQRPPAELSSQGERPEFRAALAGITRTSAGDDQWPLEAKSISLAMQIRRDGVVTGVVRTAARADAVDAAVRNIRLQVSAAGLSIALLAGGMMLGASRRVRGPLEAMRQGAERFARGDLGYKLELPPSEEMAGLAAALNQMAGQLEERIVTISRQGNEQDAVLASMVEGVLAVDTEERIISINAAAAALLNTAESGALGRGLQEVIRNADLRRFVSRALACDEPIEDDVVLRSDEERVLQARGTSLRGGRGQPVGAVIVLNDVTHLRRLENIRRDFVANVSHELKTPITSIKGFVETLLDGALQKPADAERFLRIVAKQADRLNSIIEDLLCLAKIEQSVDAADVVLQEYRVCDVLQSAIDECTPKASERRICMRLTCEPEILAEMNPPLVEQAVMNLLDNAIKYSDDGSEVVVEAVRQASEIAIRVHDRGCGIEEEHLDRLFERFYRVDKARSRKLGGTGLGLSIVKHIVHVHGGHVTVDSAAGKGSTFTIFLPAP